METNLVQKFFMMGLGALIIGFTMGRVTTPPEIVVETKIEKKIETKIVRQFEQTNAQRECLAQAIFAESRSQTEAGQLAVATSIMNRVADNRYPDTICGVVEYKTVRKGKVTYHFSYQYKKDPNFYKTTRVFANMRVSAKEVKARNKAYEMADKVLDGVRTLPSNSLNYHSTAISPDWADTLTLHTKIGDHKFYTGF